MPSTINGIGTTYSGKTNVQSHVGKCEHCGKVYELESYDTKLYFCFLFIPLIPLGEKRILNMCPGCSRHRAVNGKEWKQVSETAIQTARQTFDTAPTETNVLKAHIAMLAFGRLDEAANFRQSVQQFNHSAAVQAGFGEALDEVGQYKVAEAYYGKAYDLDPTLPAARAGIAREYIRSGDLQSARTLLDFLERPGSETYNSMGPLEDLADAAQAKKQHEMALELYARLLQALPIIGSNPMFRKKVLVSERALKRPTSILPGRSFGVFTFLGQPVWDGGSFTWGAAALTAFILLVVVGGSAIGNEYIRTHRSIYFVSGLPQKTPVEVVGVGKIEVTDKSQELLQVEEGTYKINIGGPSPQTVELDTRSSGYIARFFDGSFWVVNVRGSAMLVEEHATYTVDASTPSTYRFHFGNVVSQMGGIDHVFTDMPEKVSLKRSESKRLTGLTLFKGDVTSLLESYLSTHPDQYYDVVEWQLTQDPDNASMLERYFLGALTSQAVMTRLDNFLARGLKEKPFHVTWHAIYRRINYSKERDAKMTALYDEAIKANPKEASALFLRGTLDTANQSSWFQKATAADAKYAWPYVATAYQKMAQADWTGARKDLNEALEGEGGHFQAISGLLDTCLAMGEAPDLEKSFRESIEKEPTDLVESIYLIYALAAQNKAGKGEDVVAKYGAAVKEYGDEGKRALASVRRAYYYAVGDFKKLDTSIGAEGVDLKKDMRGEIRWARTTALLEQGKPDSAVKTYPYLASPFTAFQHLAFDLTFRAEGNLASALKWEESALAQLEKGTPIDSKVAEMLKSTTPPDLAALKALDLRIADKAVLCTVLGAKHPSKQGDYFGMARQLNVLPKFPWHMVNRLAGGKFTFPLPK